MQGKVIEKIFERLSDSFLSYFHLGRFIDSKIVGMLSSSETHKIRSCYDFYQGLWNGDIKLGHKVLFENVFMTEWFPRQPGKIANLVFGGQFGRDTYDSFIKYLPSGSDFHGLPLGSVRMNNSNGKYRVLGITTPNEYVVDQGIVVVMSKTTYLEFLAKQISNNAAEVTLEGYIDLVDYSKKFEFIKKWRKVPQEAIDRILGSSWVVRVDSPLQAEFKFHNSHPVIFTWAIRKITGSRVGEVIVDEWGDQWVYPPFDYVSFPISDSKSESLVRASKILSELPVGAMTFGADRYDQMKLYRLPENEQRIPLTEFDDKAKLYNTELPIRNLGTLLCERKADDIIKQISMSEIDP